MPGLTRMRQYSLLQLSRRLSSHLQRPGPAHQVSCFTKLETKPIGSATQHNTGFCMCSGLALP